MKILPSTHSLFRFVLEVFRQFFRNRCAQRAAGLAYSSLLAIVPLFTVLLSFGGSFMDSEPVQAFLAETLLPTSQEAIIRAIGDFADNSSRLGAMGLLIFLITVVILLNNVEIHLSTIFRIRSEKTLLVRFTTYTAVLVFAGLFIGASMTLSGNLFNAILETFGRNQFSTQFIRQISSLLFIFLTLLLLILLMPSGKIRLTSAMIGAGTGCVLWEIAKRLFAAWANHSVRISVIYGSLFLIPLLLIWIYVVWILILFAVEVTYVHQHKEFCYFKDTGFRYPGAQLRDGIRLYSVLADNFTAGEEPLQLPDLSRKLNLPDMEVQRLLDLYLETNMLLRVRLHAKQDGYVPGAPPEHQSLEEIVRILLHGRKRKTASLTNRPEDKIMTYLDTALQEILTDKTAGEILNRHE